MAQVSDAGVPGASRPVLSRHTTPPYTGDATPRPCGHCRWGWGDGWGLRTCLPGRRVGTVEMHRCTCRVGSLCTGVSMRTPVEVRASACGRACTPAAQPECTCLHVRTRLIHMATTARGYMCTCLHVRMGTCGRMDLAACAQVHVYMSACGQDLWHRCTTQACPALHGLCCHGTQRHPTQRTPHHGHAGFPKVIDQDTL